MTALIKYIPCCLIALLIITNNTEGAEVVQLPVSESSDVNWQPQEKRFYSESWGVELISNISTPTLTIHKPLESKANGKAVIVAPGGGLYYNSIQSEGIEVANWLTQQGYLVAILKYRLVPTGKLSVADLANDEKKPLKYSKKINQVLPLSVRDGLEALKYLKSNAKRYSLHKDNVGFMGFSAGGAVALGVAYGYEKETRPDFLVTIYPWTEFLPIKTPPIDAPPLLVICASNDELNLAADSIQLFNVWYKAGLSAELHMYAKGGHGFGMRKDGLAKDSWIQRFDDWVKDL